MKARITRFDACYEVVFSRPSLSRVSSFVQIIEPIYDALSEELHIPPDAIRVENGNTIDTALVTVSLSSQNCFMEARLNGYKVDFFALGARSDIDRVKRVMKRFEAAVSEFLSDGLPVTWKLRAPLWLTIEGGVEGAGNIIRDLTRCPEEKDPFGIGVTRMRPAIIFECSNDEEIWSVSIHLNISRLQNSHLFLDISSEYGRGSRFDAFDERVDHLAKVVDKVLDKLGLAVE